MRAQSFVAVEGEPLDGLVERFVGQLGLPAVDPEVQDIAAIVGEALETARQTDRAEVLGDALRFAQGRLEVRGLSVASVREVAAGLLIAAGPLLTADQRDHVGDLLDRCGAEPVAGSPQDSMRLAPESASYLKDLLQGDRRAAISLIRRCATDGMDVSQILTEVLEPAQHEVGRRWALGDISVAQEHYCTAVTEFVMSDLYPGMFSGEESPHRLLALHAPGSLHHVGLRMVTDVLECRGWSTTYVGEDIAIEALPTLLAENRADLLLISASMPSQIRDVKAMVRAVHQDPRTRLVKVVVGGRPFLVAPALVDEVGADAWAPDARSTVEVCNALMGGDGGERR